MAENKTRGTMTADQLAALGLDKQPPTTPGEMLHAQANQALGLNAGDGTAAETTPSGTLNTTVPGEGYFPFQGEEVYGARMLDLGSGRTDFLVEVLGNYRKQLESLVRREAVTPANAYGHGSLLNPVPADSQDTRLITAAERGIAKCNQLLAELGITPEMEA